MKKLGKFINDINNIDKSLFYQLRSYDTLYMVEINDIDIKSGVINVFHIEGCIKGSTASDHIAAVPETSPNFDSNEHLAFYALTKEKYPEYYL